MGAGQQASPVSKKFVEIHCGDFSPKKEFTRDKSSHGHLVYLVPVTQYGRNRFYSVPNSMPILKIRCMHLLLLPCALHCRGGNLHLPGLPSLFCRAFFAVLPPHSMFRFKVAPDAGLSFCVGAAYCRISGWTLLHPLPVII